MSYKRMIAAIVMATAVLLAPFHPGGPTARAEKLEKLPKLAQSASADKSGKVEAKDDADSSSGQADDTSADASDRKADNSKSRKGEIRFQFDGVAYKDVIRRFAQIAGKPIIGDYNVPGTLTFFDSRSYTFDEAFDTLNLILEMRGYALVEEDRWLRLVPLTEIGSKSKVIRGLDEDKMDDIRPGEIVTVVLPLRFIDASTASKAVVRWVSSWGSISPLVKGKGIIITDRLSKIQRIRRLLKLLDTETLVQQQLKTYPLKHASAKAVSEMINRLFGGKNRRNMIYNPTTRRYEPAPGSGPGITAAIDERTNSVLLLGAGDQLAMAEQVINKLDQEGGMAGGDVRMFQLKKARAEDIAKTVSAVVATKSTRKDRRGRTIQVSGPVKIVPDAGTNRVIVSAPVTDMPQIEKLIRELDEATTISGGARIFELEKADAAQLSGIIQSAMSTRDRRGRRVSNISVSVDPRNNLLIVSGAGGDIDTAAKLIEQLDIEPDTDARDVRVIPLKAGSARDVGRSLQRVFSRETTDSRGRKRLESTITVEAESSTNTLIIAASPNQWKEVNKVLEEITKSAADQATPITRLVKLEHAKADELARTLQTIFSPRRSRYRRTSAGDVPVTIVPSTRSNSLVISAAEGDHQAIGELITSLDVESTEKIEPFMMLRVKSAKAEDVVSKVQAMLPRPRRGQPQDVYLQADKLTNSILLRAPESKRKMIEGIIAKLDQATDAEARITQTVALKHSSAAEMADVLRSLYSGGSSSRSRWGRRRGSSASGDDSVIITPAPGDRTLVIDAPKAKLREIIELIGTLDNEDAPGKMEIRTYQLAASNAGEVAGSLARLYSQGGRRGSTAQGQPRIESDSGSNQLIIRATADQFEDIEALIEKITKASKLRTQTKTIKLQYVKVDDLVPTLQEMLTGSMQSSSRYRRGRRGGSSSGGIRIASLKLANTLIIQAPPEKMALAEELIKTFDTEEAGLQTTVEIVQLENAEASSLADAVTSMLAGQSSGRRGRRNIGGDESQIVITPETNANVLLVRGPATEVGEVVTLIKELDAESSDHATSTRTFKLAHAKADDLVPVLESMITGQSRSTYRGRYRRSSSQPGVSIAAVKGANAIVVKAPHKDMELAELLIKQFDTEESGAKTMTEIVTILNADASSLADAVMSSIGGGGSRRGRRGSTGSDEVTVIPESNSNSLLVRGPQGDVKRVVAMIKKLDADSDAKAVATKTFKLAHAKADDLVPMLESMITGQSRSTYRGRYRRSSSQPGVSIAAVKGANAIVIKATQKDMDLAELLIKQFDTEESGAKTTTEIVTILNADAGSLAEAVMSSISGRSSSRGRRGTTGSDEVSVIPESNSNSLLVRGPQGDVKRVVAMIKKLDADSDAKAVTTRTFELAHAKASELATIIENMLGQATSRSRWGRRRSPGSGEIRVSAVTSTNAILVKAPKAELKLAEKLIGEFDVEKASRKPAVRIVQLENADAASLADSVNATLAGQASSRSRYRRGSTPTDEDRVVVIPESNSNSVLVRGPADEVPEVVAMIERIDADSTTLASQTRTFKLQFVKVDDMLPVLQQITESSSGSRYSRGRRGSSSGSVRIAAMKAANTIVVQGSPDKLALAEELVKTFDTKDSGVQTAIEIVKLEAADPGELADSVNATLTGQSGRSRWSRRGSESSGDTVKVIPETNSSSVLVRGPAGEVPDVVAMIEKLDAEAAAKKPQARTFQLKHAKASDLASVIESIISTQTTTSRWRRGRRSSSGAAISVTPVPNTNALVVKAPKAQMAQAAALIEEFDAEDAAAAADTVIVRLKNADAATLADAVNASIAGQSSRRSRWSRGSQDTDQVVAIAEGNSNSLLVRGPKAQIPPVVEMISKLDADSSSSQTRTFTLKHAKASDIVELLEPMLAETSSSYRGRRSRSTGAATRVAAVKAANAVVVQGPAEKLALAEQLIQQFDQKETAQATIQIVKLQKATADTLADAVNSALADKATSSRRYRRPSGDGASVTVTPEVNSNSVLVRGPKALVDETVEMIRKLDADSQGSQVAMRVYPLENSEATQLATSLQKLFQDILRQQSRGRRNAPTVPFSVAADTRTNSLVVSTTPAHFTLVEDLLDRLDKEEERADREAEYIWLENADAMTVADQLTAMYKDRRGPDKPVIESDIFANALTLIGKEADLKAMRQVVQKLDEAAKDNNVRVRVITLKGASAEKMADLIRQIYGQVTDSEIVVTDKLPEKKQGGKTEEPLINFMPSPDEVDANQADAKNEEGQVDEGHVKLGDGEAEQEKSKVTIAVDPKANALIISATRRELDDIEDLIYRLTENESVDEAQLRQFKLAQADPVSVAQTLNSLFNPPQPKQPQKKGRNNQQQQPAPIKQDVTVVADARTKSVIVRAKPEDMQLIEGLIAQLDQVSTIVSEVRVFGLKNTDATDVAANLRDLFKMSGSQQSTRSRRGNNRNNRNTPNDQRAEMVRQVIELQRKDGVTQVDVASQVSITANTKTNSVVCIAPSPAMELIEKLIQELDQSAAESKASVRMYPVKHAEVKAMVATLQEIFAGGSRSTRSRGRQTSSTDAPVVITADEGGKQVVVSAPPERHELIAKVIGDLDSAQASQETMVKVYRIRHVEATGVADALTSTLTEGGSSRGRRGQANTGGGLRISADRSSNAIVVRASEEEHTEIESLLARLDLPPGGEGEVQLIPLTNADPEEVARTLSSVFGAASQSRSRRGRGSTPTQGVVIEADKSARMLMVRADEETFGKIRSLAAKLDASAMGEVKRTILEVTNAKATNVAAAMSQAFAPQRGQRTSPDDLVTIVAEPMSNTLIVSANERNLKKVQSLLKQLDTESVEGARSEFVLLKHAKATDLAEVLSTVSGGSSGSRRGRRGQVSEQGVVVTADAASNALVMSGPSKDIERLMEMALKLDVAAAEKSVAVIKTYSVTKADVSSMATALQEVFPAPTSRNRRGQTSGETPVVIVPDVPGQRLVVSATEDKHKVVAGVIEELDTAETGNQIVVRVYKLQHAEARSLGWTLQQSWQQNQRARNASTDTVKITGESSSNSIVVRGPQRDQEEIAALIEKLDAPATATEYEIRSIPINNASPSEVAETLQRVMGVASSRGRRGWGQAKDSIVIEASSDSRKILVRADDKTFEKIRELAVELDKETLGKETRTVLPLKYAESESVATAMSRAFAPQRGQRVSPEDAVTIVAEPASNSLIVSASEKNLTKVKALLAKMDTEESGGRRTEFLLLQKAKATELAEVLSKASGAGSSRGRRGSSSRGTVITADAGSNALVMTGPSGDLDKLMKMALQLDQATMSTTPGVYIIGLENGDARDVAAMVENLYRSQADAARKDKKSIDPLAVSADERANAIVLATTEQMYKVVSGWVEEVEELQPKRGKFRLIPLENADPAEVEKVIQQMLEKGGAMAPRRNQRNRRNQTSGSSRAETTVLEEQRAIMVEASDEDFEAIMKVVKALDAAAAEAKQEVKVFAMKNASNVRVASALSQLYRATRGQAEKDQVTITALQQTNAVVVSAAKEKMAEVAHVIEQLDKKEVAPQVEIRIYPLENAQPQKIVGPLKSMLTQVVKTQPGESIDVQADERTKSIIVTAKGDFFDQVEKIIKVLDKSPAYARSEVLIIPLQRADATNLAAVLNEMLRPSATNEVTPEIRALQEQIKRLKVRSTIKEDIPELDLSKPIKITADPARPQGSNALIVSSTEENLAALRAIVEILDTVPVTEGTKVRIIHLKNADAQTASTILKDIFTQGQRLGGKQGTSVQGRAQPRSTSGKGLVNPLNVSADLRTNTLVLSGLEESIALAEAVLKDLDKVQGKIVTEVKVFPLANASAANVANLLLPVFTSQEEPDAAGVRTYVTRLRMVLNEQEMRSTRIPKARNALTIQADEASNLLIVAARSDVMPLIAETIKTLDVPADGAVEAVRIFPLTHADATRISQVVQTLYQGANAQYTRREDRPTIAVDTRTNSLVVTASERTFAVMDQLLRKLDAKQEVDVRGIRMLPLENAEASSLASTLQKMMDARVERQSSLGVKDAESLRVIIESDPRSNSLIVGGSKESYEIVADLVKQLDGASPALGGQIQIFELQEANAGSLASTLTNLFEQRYQAARTDDVRRQKPIILPDLRTNALLVAANADDSKVLTGLLEKLDVEQKDPAVRLTVIPLVHNDAGAVGPTIEGIFSARLEAMTAKGEEPSPQDRVDVEADSLSNALIVSASKENLGLIEDLLKKIDVEPASKTGIVRIFPLETASAARVAGMLKSLVSQGLYKPGLIAAGQNAARQAMEKVAIEFDTRTNVLIVSASKENFAVIEEIIEKIDSSDDYATAGDIQTFGLKHADATKLAPTLQEFFRSKRQAEISAGGSDQTLPTTIIADARTNTILAAGSREAFAAIDKMIRQLDSEESAKATTFQVFDLEYATAAGLQATLQKLFDGRVERGDTKTAVTIIADPKVNALVVGATGDDLKLARELIKKLDRKPEADGAGNMQVFPLVKADASEVAETLKELFPAQDGVETVGVSVDERINAVIVTAGAADMKRVTELVEKLDRKSVTKVTEIRVFTLKNADAEELASILTDTLTNKPKAMTATSPNRQTLLQFVGKTKGGKELLASALQEGVLITPDPRTNSMVVSAPADSMKLLETLITSLDSTTPPAAEIRVFKLENAKATSMADVLTQLFRLQGTNGNGNKSVKYTLVSKETTGKDGTTATLGTAEQYALSVTVDVRTNSLLVSGTKQYVDLADKVIQELDASPAQERPTKVYRLRNATATDLEETLQTFLDRERQRLEQTLGTEGMAAAQRLLEREVTVVAEDSSNALLLSASPQYFKVISDLIHELDAPPPQVLIQVLLAEITLDDTTEFGFDWAYQNVKDNRTYTANTNFGVEANLNASGSVSLSVTGSDLGLFFRALKSQGRLNVLQRPQIVAVDNQPAEIKVGQRVPFIENTRITDNGDIINVVQYQDVSIVLNVTPRINPDGFVKMDVDQKIESLSSSSITIQEGVNAVIVNSRSATTTVSVQDGHTILIGGLITTREDDREEKVPVLGDLPFVGNLFKSTKKTKQRTELLIVLTPRVLRTVQDADEVTERELRRMNTLRRMSSGELKDAAFKLLSGEGEGIMGEQGEVLTDPNSINVDPNSGELSEDGVPLELLPELYRRHKEMQEQEQQVETEGQEGEQGDQDPEESASRQNTDATRPEESGVLIR